MANKRISDFEGTSTLQGDEKVVLLQNGANKVVTVSKLTDYVNQETNEKINDLYNEFCKLTGGGDIKQIRHVLANHEYRIQENERQDSVRSASIFNLTKSLNDVIGKINIHHYDIQKNRNDIYNNKQSISYLNNVVSDLAYSQASSYSYIQSITYNLEQLSNKIDTSYTYACSYAADLSYGVESRVVDMMELLNTFHQKDIDRLQKQHNDEVEYNNTYVFSYIHYGRDQYWGLIDEAKELFEDECDLDSYTNICDNPNC